MSAYDTVFRCAAALLAGRVVQVGGVSAGMGTVIDWRTVRSGETLQSGGDAYDTARLFVALVGDDAAREHFACVPEVTAFMARGDGARRRAFTIRGLTVYVEPHEDDTMQEHFTADLARAAAALLAEVSS
jgi:hypothetical protein